VLQILAIVHYRCGLHLALASAQLGIIPPFQLD